MNSQDDERNLFNQLPEFSSQHAMSAKDFQQIQSIQAYPNHDRQPQHTTHTTVYRPQIDGLRTVAIALVVIYHAFPQYLPGGFIGVDIFFVISGYLISQIIIKQTQNGHFSYLDFYTRRVKRIFPALMLVLFFTLYTVAMHSEKDQLKLTLRTLKASTVFGANIEVLTYKKGYFDAELRANPLLHLWSLGVQEQFYIIWPWLLALVLKHCKKWTLLILILYAVASFGYQIWNTQTNPKFAFYFPLCRFWQMAIGGILAYANLNIASKKINDLLSTIAIVAISITMLILSDSSKFPGYWALIPTLSSALIIQSKDSFINKQVLSSAPFVFLGKISYSLYLWHWPFLILCHTYYPYGSRSLWASNFFILFVVLVVSVATYFMAENQVRGIKGKKVAIALIILMAGVLYAGFWVEDNILNKLDLNQHKIVRLSKAAEEQMKPRDPEDFYFNQSRKHSNPSISNNRQRPTVDKLLVHYREQQYDDSVKGKQFLLDKDVHQNSIFYNQKMVPYFKHYEVSNEGQEKLVLLIGDSHSSKITHRFQQLYKQSLLKFTPFPTVISLVRFGMFDITKEDEEARELMLQFVDQHRPERVFITRHWLLGWCWDLEKEFDVPADCNMKRLEEHLAMIVNFIKELQRMDCEVSISQVGIQYWSLHPNKMKDGSGELIEDNLRPFKLSDYMKKYEKVIDKYHLAIKPLSIELIRLTDNHCWENMCQRFTPSGHPIMADSNHYGKLFARHWMTAVDHLVDF